MVITIYQGGNGPVVEVTGEPTDTTEQVVEAYLKAVKKLEEEN